MKDTLLLGLGRFMISIPGWIYWRTISREGAKAAAGLRAMSEDHRRVRSFVVGELRVVGKPIPPQHVAERLDLPVARVGEILDDLDRSLTFLVRNPQGEVTWAYPVTVDRTPHALAFPAGEPLYAA